MAFNSTKYEFSDFVIAVNIKSLFPYSNAKAPEITRWSVYRVFALASQHRS